MTDVRDSTKIASLPPDLKAIADEMVAEKFGLAKKGEVQEKQKKAPRVSEMQKDQTWANKMAHWFENTAFGTYSMGVDIAREEATSYGVSKTLSIDDLRRAQQMLRRGESNDYGMTPKEWVRLMGSDPQFRARSYSFRDHGWQILFEGIHTGKRAVHIIPEGVDAPQYVTHLRDKVQHELLEPVVIKDPRDHR